jgi:prophage regulatory protein
MVSQDFEYLLPVAEVCRQTSRSRAFIYDLMNRGGFPKPIRLSPNRIAWPQSAVAKWIGCQTACNRDPLSAPKRDPFAGCRAAMRVAIS